MSAAGLLGNLVSEAAVNSVSQAYAHPRTQATLCRVGAKAAGVGATQAEYVARSLRRTEESLNTRALQLERGEVPDGRSAWQVVRDCWRE